MARLGGKRIGRYLFLMGKSQGVVVIAMIRRLWVSARAKLSVKSRKLRTIGLCLFPSLRYERSECKRGEGMPRRGRGEANEATQPQIALHCRLFARSEPPVFLQLARTGRGSLTPCRRRG